MEYINEYENIKIMKTENITIDQLNERLDEVAKLKEKLEKEEFEILNQIEDLTFEPIFDDTFVFICKFGRNIFARKRYNNWYRLSTDTTYDIPLAYGYIVTLLEQEYINWKATIE